MAWEILLLIIIPIILLVVIIWAIFDVVKSDMTTQMKAVWIILLLMFSLITLIVWLFVRNKV
ncbi:hypothetical protein CMI37_09290 [Candidatus Pacearchaeota archaeon]|nr:hypothetical protein [Candidatus Pacearchaeota archaeon]